MYLLFLFSFSFFFFFFFFCSFSFCSFVRFAFHLCSSVTLSIVLCFERKEKHKNFEKSALKKIITLKCLMSYFVFFCCCCCCCFYSFTSWIVQHIFDMFDDKYWRICALCVRVSSLLNVSANWYIPESKRGEGRKRRGWRWVEKK